MSIENDKNEVIVDTSANENPIYRRRHFYDFSTPSFMNVSEEITLLNSIKDSNASIILDVPKYMSNLHIYDSKGRILEFHAHKKNDGDVITGASCLDSNICSKIKIEFPKDELFYNGEFKTIRLEEIGVTTDIKLLSTDITIKLEKNVSVHAYIKECDNYEFDIDYSIVAENGETIEKSNLVVHKENRFLEFYSNSAQNNNELINFVIKHKIPDSVLNWYKLGLIYGFGLIILVYLLYHYNPSSITEPIAIASIGISVLIVIKGWFNQWEMIRPVVRYDQIYYLLLIIIAFEIFALVIHNYIIA